MIVGLTCSATAAQYNSGSEDFSEDFRHFPAVEFSCVTFLFLVLLFRQDMIKIIATDCLCLTWGIISECGILNISWFDDVKLLMSWSWVCLCYWRVLIVVQSDMIKTEIIRCDVGIMFLKIIKNCTVWADLWLIYKGTGLELNCIPYHSSTCTRAYNFPLLIG